MSTLTKLFVILLIVCSIVLSSALVVFVNTQEDFKTALSKADASLATEKNKTKQIEVQLAAAKANESAAVAARRELGLEKDTALATKQRDIDAKDQSINELKAAAAVQSANLTQAVETNKVAQSNITELTKRVETLTKESDDVRVRNTELVGSNTDLTKQLDEERNQRRWLQEKVAQVNADYTKATALLRDRGISTDAAPRSVKAPVALQGVIRQVQGDANGQVHAMISLGTDQHVQAGMQFSVVSGDKFMGVLTVESVDQNSSFGRLEGPAVADIRANNQVFSN